VQSCPAEKKSKNTFEWERLTGKRLRYRRGYLEVGLRKNCHQGTGKKEKESKYTQPVGSLREKILVRAKRPDLAEKGRATSLTGGDAGKSKLSQRLRTIGMSNKSPKASFLHRQTQQKNQASSNRILQSELGQRIFIKKRKREKRKGTSCF